jgi:hypothetical protein
LGAINKNSFYCLADPYFGTGPAASWLSAAWSFPAAHLYIPIRLCLAVIGRYLAFGPTYFAFNDDLMLFSAD